MSVAAALLVRVGADTSEAESKLSSFRSGLDGAARNLATSGMMLSAGITAPVAGIGLTALKSAGEFEQGMNLLQEITNATGAEMAAMETQALALGAATSFSAGAAADGMLELGKAGLSAQEVMAAIPGVLDLAAAGGLNLGSAAEITANALNAYGLGAEEAERVANMLAAAANASSIEVTDQAMALKMSAAVMSSYGQSIDDTNTALAILGNAGLKGSDAGTSLKTMMMALGAPTDTAAQAMKDFGVEIYDAEGNMRDLPAILASLQNAMFGTHTVMSTVGGRTQEQSERMSYLGNVIERTQRKLADYQSGLAGVAQSEADKVVAVDRLNRELAAAQAEYATLAGIQGKTVESTRALSEAERNAALAMIFGTDAVRAINILLQAGSEGWEEMAEATGDATAAQRLAQAQMEGWRGALEYFRGSVDSFLIGQAAPFLDWLSGLVRSAADGITAFGELDAGARNAALAFLGVLAAAGPVMLALAGLLTAVSFLLTPLGLLTAGSAALAAAWAADFGGIRERTRATIDAMRPGFESLLGWIGQVREGGWGPLREGLQGALGRVTATIQNFAWRDYLPTFTTTELFGYKISALRWGDFVGVFSWESLTTILKWGEYIYVLDWGAYISRLIDWGEYISPLVWEFFVQRMNSWGGYIAALDWKSIVATLGDWGLYVRELLWGTYLPPLVDWDAYLSALDWKSIVATLTDWTVFVALLPWNTFVKALNWATYLMTLDWGTWIKNLNWRETTQPLDWKDFIVELGEWHAFVTRVAWESFIARLELPALVPGLLWGEFVTGVTLGDLIDRLKWTDFIDDLSWGAWVADLSWDDYLTELLWKIFVDGVQWSDFIPSLNWPTPGDILDAIRGALPGGRNGNTDETTDQEGAATSGRVGGYGGSYVYVPPQTSQRTVQASQGAASQNIVIQATVRDGVDVERIVQRVKRELVWGM